MAKQLNIRGVPEEIAAWIKQRIAAHGVSQQELLMGVLRNAVASDRLPLFEDIPKTPSVTPDSVPFQFIDLFAGIGGLRIGLERAGGRCVYSCEWNKYAQKTYSAWYGHVPEGDITKIDKSKIPFHHVLAAGFPCQPFSIAGVSKKNALGQAHGFKDVAQGTMFFHLASIIELKRPPVLMLENVKNLRSHDSGKTWTVIRTTLERLGYTIFDKVIDASAWVPQHRERVFIVGFSKQIFGDNPMFEFPESPAGKPKLKDVLDASVDDRYTLTDHLWNYLQNYAAKHKAKGNGFGFGMADVNGVTRTLSARYYKDGSEILIPQKGGKNPRRLTPREAHRLMGFPEDKKIVVSDTQAYKQYGNAVVPLVAEAVARQIAKVIYRHMYEGSGCFRQELIAS